MNKKQQSFLMFTIEFFLSTALVISLAMFLQCTHNYIKVYRSYMMNKYILLFYVEILKFEIQ